MLEATTREVRCERFVESRHGRLRLTVIAVAAAMAFDLGLRGGVSNAVVALAVVLVVLVLLADRRVEQTAARWIALAAIAPTVFLGLRASPWLAVTNVVTIAGLLATAIAYARSGSVLDTRPHAMLTRFAAAGMRAVSGFALARSLLPTLGPRRARRMTRVGGAVLVAVPMLAVVVALLASADAVFARLLVPDIPLGPAFGHVLLGTAFAVVVVGIAAAASGHGTERTRNGYFGVLEIVTMLGLAAGVLALFVISQLIALTDAGRRLVGSSGLTPAQYARGGFFQLCWATAILVAFLAVVRALAAPGVLARPTVRVLAAAVPALALGLVIVSLKRMVLYDRAFGMTMLRLWVVGAAIWMGGILLMAAARNIGVGAARDWLIGGAGVLGVALVMFANIANPEAFVARHNIARAAAGSPLDLPYLATLSDDAIPAISHAMTSARNAAERAELRRALRCGAQTTGVAALNVAQARAAHTRHDLC